MARQGRTQKQIAERYRSNLGYYRKIHPWRRAQLLVGIVAILVTLTAIWIFLRIGNQTFFNAGPITSQHGAIANKCEACHENTFSHGSAMTGRTFTTVVKERFR